MSILKVFQTFSYTSEGVTSPAPAIAGNLSCKSYLFEKTDGLLWRPIFFPHSFPISIDFIGQNAAIIVLYSNHASLEGFKIFFWTTNSWVKEIAYTKVS